MEDVLDYASQTKTSLTRIMLDNMVVPLPNGDVDTSMLKEAVRLVNGRFETEVIILLSCTIFGLFVDKSCFRIFWYCFHFFLFLSFFFFCQFVEKLTFQRGGWITVQHFIIQTPKSRGYTMMTLSL